MIRQVELKVGLSDKGVQNKCVAKGGMKLMFLLLCTVRHIILIRDETKDETYVLDVTSLDFTFHAIGLHYCIRTWRAATKALLAFPGTESHTLV